MLCSGSFDGTVRFYDLSSSTNPRFVCSVDVQNRVVCLQTIGGDLAVGTKERSTKIYSVNHNSDEWKHGVPERKVSSDQENLAKIESSLGEIMGLLEEYKQKMSSLTVINQLQKESEEKSKVVRKLQQEYESIQKENELLQQRLDDEQLKYDNVQSKLDDEAKLANCLFCCSRRRSVLFMPCGHLICCSDCILELQKRNQACPVCRKGIEVVLHCKLI